MGIPTSVYGVIFNLAILTCDILGKRIWVRTFKNVVVLSGIAIGLILVLVGRFSYHVVCTWCVLHLIFVAAGALFLVLLQNREGRGTASIMQSTALAVLSVSAVVWFGFFRGRLSVPHFDQRVLSQLSEVELYGPGCEKLVGTTGIKLVVFTNPKCSACQGIVPGLLKTARAKGVVPIVRYSQYDTSVAALDAAWEDGQRLIPANETLLRKKINADFKLGVLLDVRSLPFIIWYSDGRAQPLNSLSAEMRLDKMPLKGIGIKK